MNYRTPTISHDNFALHRDPLQRDKLNAKAAIRKQNWQARRRSLGGMLIALKGYLKRADCRITTRRATVTEQLTNSMNRSTQTSN